VAQRRRRAVGQAGLADVAHAHGVALEQGAVGADGAEGIDGAVSVTLSGHWRLHNAPAREAELANALTAVSTMAVNSTRWSTHAIESLDSAGALVLWRAWGRQLPAQLDLSDEHARVFERIALADAEPRERAESAQSSSWLHGLGQASLTLRDHLIEAVALLGQIALDLFHVLRHPREIPLHEISANLAKSGAHAMPVAALVGFLIGVVLSYLSALQLRQFGAETLIVNILGLGIVRELGPVLVAVLVAGRSGSAMTAQLGVMRVTEEIDALATMGVSRSVRLILPKVCALAIAMPLLVLWTTLVALFGGMLAAQIQLDIDFDFFVQTLPRVVPVANLWIGLAKGFVFGICIALVACYYGLRVRPNTESLSANTTASVVSAITSVIIIDAIFAIATRHIGLPGL
jgi:phospholipid/cholesterol/gamma-HCH transport system permease protein